MREQLAALLDSRSHTETTLLNDRLKELRSNMMSTNTWYSSMYINSTVRICADYMENYCKGALEDYKHAISSDSDKYDENYLFDTARIFLSRLSQEKDAVQGILEKNAGDIAASMSPNGLEEYQYFDITFQSVWGKSKAEAEIFNAKLFESRPTLINLLKEKWGRNRFFGTISIIFALFLVIAGIFSAWSSIQDTLKKLFI
ncbi:hypothetical protein [Undibacterium sp.]|uniref:hypothetical protein n=1 Tax=Undibacterium sp. TaxID=1914977 RepID=UPI0027300D7B|nr:hypothetical protein [Undibacterium sp.]MDP1980462.1 hypothetical protein [Undibacterium sp.]